MSSPLWWRGLRSRLAPNLLLLTLSAVAVMTASLGPLLVRAIDQNTVTDTVAQAGAGGTAITAITNGEPKEDLQPLRDTVGLVLAQVLDGPASGLWQPTQVWVESIGNLAWSSATRRQPGERSSRVQVVDQGCSALVLTSGTCPSAGGQVLVSATDAAADDLAVGSRLVYRLPDVPEARFTVVGTYDPDRVATPITRPDTDAGLTASVDGDPVFMTAAQLATLPLPTQVAGRLVLRGPVTTADVPLLRSSVTTVGAAVLTQQRSIAVSTGLTDVLDRVDSQRAAAGVLIGVSEAQAFGLTAFALAVVLSRVEGERRAEWGVGRLLGVPRRRWLWSVYAEPALPLLAGLPLGLGAAAAVGGATIAATMRPGTPLELFRWPVLVAAVAAVGVGLVALVGVSLPSLRRPLAELIAERSESARVGRLSAVAQTAAVLLAAATLYTLLAGGVLDARGSQLGLLAPGLFALALALLGIRVAVLLVRRLTRRPSRRLVGLVVGRHLARAPSALTPAVVVSVGLACAVLATQVLALSVRNQELRADAVTGASTVLHVDAPRGTDLTAVVRAADPGGRSAMAVQERAREVDRGTNRVVAVDSERLAAVAAWSPGWSGLADLSALRPARAAPIRVTGTRLQVDLDGVRVTPGTPLTATKGPAQPRLEAVLDLGARWRTVDLGVLAGARRLTAPVPCGSGCRLVALGTRSGALQPYVARLTVTGVSTDTQPVSSSVGWLTDPDRWHPRVGTYYNPDPPAYAEPTAGGRGLALQVTDTEGDAFPSVAPSDVTDPLPAVLGPSTELQAFAGIPGAAYGVGIDGSSQLLTVLGRAVVLPRALGDGVLVDLPAAAALSDPQNDSAVSEVWLAPDAPASVEQALTGAGLTVTGREQLADTRATLLREPTTRGAAVALSLAYASLLLTLLALVAARVADARRRRADWRSLADAGLRVGTVRRLVATEIAVPALLGALLGVGSGLVALRLAAPRLPLVDLTTPGPPLDLRISWPPAVLIALGAAFVVVVVALVGAALETRASGEER